MALAPGTRLGTYEVIAPLGAGGMGEAALDRNRQAIADGDHIFGRAMRQLAIGLVIGWLVSAAIFLSAGMAPGRATGLLVAVAGLMVIVASFAALGPARRGLRIQTVEALRVDG